MAKIKKVRTLCAIARGWKKVSVVVVEMEDGSRWYTLPGEDDNAYKTGNQIRSGMDLRKLTNVDTINNPGGFYSVEVLMDLIDEREEKTEGYIGKINKEISEYFGESGFYVGKDHHCGCDLHLAEAWMSGKADKPEPEGRRDAVAAYIFHEHPEVKTIAYGGAYYSRDSLMVAIFRGWKR